MLRRFLFVLLLLGFVISMPYEVSAAPRKETKKERRERLKREEERRKRRQKTPPPQKKITPTFEEKLTPAQVNRKIQTFRRRIETAPENVISSRDKPVFWEIFDDAVQTPIGRFTFEKATSNLNFCVGTVGGAARYAPGKQCITISKESFDRVHGSKTPEERATRILSMASTLVHEATHSVQYANNLYNRSNTSFEENITLYKLFELQASLQEDVSGYQMSNLPKYRTFVQKGTINFTPAQRFYRELFDAYKETGVTEERAHRSARTKFVETYWRNDSKMPIQIGNKVIHPTASNVNITIESWHMSYNFFGFSRLPHRNVSSNDAMRDRGIERQLRRLIGIMGIDINPSFFKDSRVGAFDMPSSKRIIGYADGIRNREIDALTMAFVSKGYENGTFSYFKVRTIPSKNADGNYTDYYDETRQKKSTYTYKNGKMNGIYREYDRNGQQILEIPVENDQAHGEGWSLENGKRVVKKFRHGYWYNQK